MGVDNRSSLVSDEDFGHVDQDDSFQDVGFCNFICHLLRLAVVSTSSNFQPTFVIFIAVSFDDYIKHHTKKNLPPDICIRLWTILSNELFPE